MAAAAAAPIGSTITYQGKLDVDGQAADGLFDLQLCLFDTLSGGAPVVCAPMAGDIPAEHGIFTVEADFGADFTGQARYLELRIRDGDAAAGEPLQPLAPRQALRPAPESLHSAATPWTGITGIPEGFADGVDHSSTGVSSLTAGLGLTGGTITQSGTVAVDTGVIQRRVTGSCAGGALSAVNPDGSVQCAPTATGTVTSVGAGTGLTGGPITTSGSLAVNPFVVQSRVSGTCAVGNAVSRVNQDGSVQCVAVPAGTVQSVGAGTGLTGGPITSSGTLSIANGGVGLAQIDTAQVQARVTAGCPPGTAISAVLANGGVSCTALPGLPITSVVDADPDASLAFYAMAVGSDGLPVVAYSNFQAVKLAKCTDAACAGAKTLRTIHTSAAAVQHVSLAMRPGNLPAVAFYEGAPLTTLRLVMCDTADCATAQVRQIGTAGGGGTHASVVVGSDGKAGVAYIASGAAGALMFAKCNDAACSTHGIVTVDAAGPFAHAAAAVAATDSLPQMAYIDVATGASRFAACTTSNCSTSTKAVVDDPVNVLDGPLAIAAGRFDNPYPLILYRDATSAALKAARCKSAGCATATLSVVDDPVVNSINGVGDVVIADDGLPVVSYTDGTASVVRVAKCWDGACRSGATITALDDTGNFGPYTALALGADGLPVVAYGASSIPAQLKVVRCGHRSCQ